MKNVIKNGTVFVDGRGFLGDSEEITPPKLALKTEEFRGGGMDAPIEMDMGMEKLEASFTLINFDSIVMSLFGVERNGTVSFIYKVASKSDDGTVKPHVYVMRGFIKEMDSGSMKAGEAAKLKITVTLDFYSLAIDSIPIHVIDVKNMKRIIGGVDQLAAEREALT